VVKNETSFALRFLRFFLKFSEFLPIFFKSRRQLGRISPFDPSFCRPTVPIIANLSAALEQNDLFTYQLAIAPARLLKFVENRWAFHIWENTQF